MSGCRRRLADDQWWNFCGETDMGQTGPALCTDCGGPFKLKEETKMTTTDPRADEAAKRAVEDWKPIDADIPVEGTRHVAAKDPGKGHFYVSVVKSIIRIFAGIALISTSFVAAGVLFIVAEGLGILEEIV